MPNSKRILEDISSALLDKHQKVVFLFGAGPSICAGIPGSKELKRRLWTQKLCLHESNKLIEALEAIGIRVRTTNENDLKNEVLNNATFEELMTVASQLETFDTQEERDVRIAEWLEAQIPEIYTDELKYHPSFSYEFVCHLMNNGLVRSVINMNYDEILDKAIDDELGEGKCAKVVTLEHFESMRHSDNWESDSKFFLIKPHGTRQMRRSCRYRIEFVENFEEDKRKVLERVIEDSMLIMIGYEASDNDLRNLLQGLGLNKIRKIVIVKNKPDRAIRNLLIGRGNSTDKICGYKGRDEKFIQNLSKTIYESDSGYSRTYNKFYTKATRHLIRATIYKKISPIGNGTSCQKRLIASDRLFFERIDILIEMIIYCFKVRGLFTRKALFSCPRIVSALENYLGRAGGNINPIVDLIAELTHENTGILREKKIDSFDSWYYLPAGNTSNVNSLFTSAAESASGFIVNKLQDFFMKNGKELRTEKVQFKAALSDYLGRLHRDFDYDLSQDLLVYFMPLRSIERIIERDKFRLKTEEVLKLAHVKTGASLYLMSPSSAEWFWKWGSNLSQSFKTIKIILNRDVYQIDRSLHFKNIEDGISQLKETTGKVELRRGIKYALTLAFVESEGLTSGKAIFFLREGKASAFSPIFIEEENRPNNESDIHRLKLLFDEIFELQEQPTLGSI